MSPAGRTIDSRIARFARSVTFVYVACTPAAPFAALLDMANPQLDQFMNAPIWKAVPWIILGRRFGKRRSLA
jgi:hypothetical protein